MQPQAKQEKTPKQLREVTDCRHRGQYIESRIQLFWNCDFQPGKPQQTLTNPELEQLQGSLEKLLLSPDPPNDHPLIAEARKHGLTRWLRHEVHACDLCEMCSGSKSGFAGSIHGAGRVVALCRRCPHYQSESDKSKPPEPPRGPGTWLEDKPVRHLTPLVQAKAHVSATGEPPPPGLLPPNHVRLWNLAKAMTAFAADGFKTVGKDEYEARLQVCDGCQFRIDAECSDPRCGCNLERKAKLRSSDCPQGKWAKPKGTDK